MNMYKCKSEKEKRIRDKAEKLYAKRYWGEKNYKPTYSLVLSDELPEELKFMANFHLEDIKEKNILFPGKLFDELEKSANEKNVEVSTLISFYLLQMLERDKQTRDTNGEGKRTLKKAYIKNRVYDYSQYIKTCETREQFSKNIDNNNFIKYKEFSFKDRFFDEEIYIKNFLLNFGYSIEQIEQLENEEKEIFGLRRVDNNNEMMKSNIIYIKTTQQFNNKKFDMDIPIAIRIPVRLGFHYLILNRAKGLEQYELDNFNDIEDLLNKKLSRGIKIWELYKEYLEKGSI